MRSVLAGKDPDRSPAFCAPPGVAGIPGGDRGGSRVLHLLPDQHSGGGEPAVVRLRARRDDRRQSVFSRISPRLTYRWRIAHGGTAGRHDSALCGLWLQNAVSTIISFASAGIYLAFQMVVLAALVARARGCSPPARSRWTLGWPVNVVARLRCFRDMTWCGAAHPQDLCTQLRDDRDHGRRIALGRTWVAARRRTTAGKLRPAMRSASR